MIKYYVYCGEIKSSVGSNFHKWSTSLYEVIKAARNLSSSHKGISFMVSGERYPRPGVTESYGPTIDFLNGTGIERGSQKQH